MGYSNVLLDMKHVFWPEEGEETWSRFSRKVSANLYTYWKKFQKFQDTTASVCDRKIRDFLALDYNYERKENIIHLALKNTEGNISFILRLQGEEIADVSGGIYVELEEDVYILRTTAQNVEIQLKNKSLISY